ncbi:MAG: CDP-alcohol phosphatidyltransferase family protein [Deltaproteobacteria bacterium]
MKILNIPNLLTTFRIILTPILAYMIIVGDFLTALILIIIAGVTDILDGALARCLKCETKIGSYIDPFADKMLMFACFVSLSYVGIVPLWLTAVVIGRDVVLVSGVIFLRIKCVLIEIVPTLAGKFSTCMQTVTIIGVVAFQTIGYQNLSLLMCLFLLTLVATLVAGFGYFYAGIEMLQNKNKCA